MQGEIVINLSRNDSEPQKVLAERAFCRLGVDLYFRPLVAGF